MSQPHLISSLGNKLKHPGAYLRQPVFLLLLMVLVIGVYQLVSRAVANRKPAQLVPQVITVHPHDPNSFTEGLLWHNGFLYESSGLYGQSNLRKVDLATGAVLQRVEDPVSVFGEGIALNGDQLFQLTWQENTGYIYDLSTLNRVGTISYDGEGWGLCFDGAYFFMSNGSAFIFKRDPKTFAVLNSIQVLQEGKPIQQLNELECVGNSIYANIWKTDTILRINKGSGRVTGVIDVSGLLTPDEIARAGLEGVLNGIAYDPVDDVFFITGKLWPKLFEVKFVPRTGA